MPDTDLYMILGSLDGKVSSILTALTGLEQRLTMHAETIGKLDNRITTLEANSNSSKVLVSYIISIIAALLAALPYFKGIL